MLAQMSAVKTWERYATDKKRFALTNFLGLFQTKLFVAVGVVAYDFATIDF